MWLILFSVVVGAIMIAARMKELKDIKDNVKRAFFCKDTVIPLMTELRASVDDLEMIVSSENWPYPSIGELLFGVR